MRYFIAILFSLMLTSVAQATDYFVCDTGGDDADSGLTEALAWATYEKARTTAIGTAGSTVYFCKGGTFEATNAEQRITNQVCTAASPCGISTYGTGERPKIYSLADEGFAMFEFNGTSWFDAAAGDWNDATDEEKAAQYFTMEGLHLIGRGNTWRAIYITLATHLTFTDMKYENFKLGLHILAGNDINPWSIDYITITNSEFYNIHAAGILGGSGDYLIVDNNTFDRVGYYTPVLDHAVYISTVRNSRITNNVFTNSTFSTETYVAITGATQANPVVITQAGHGYSNSDEIFIKNTGGMDMIMNTWFTIGNVTTDTYELTGIDGTGYDAYTTGSTASKQNGGCVSVILNGHGWSEDVYIGGNQLLEVADSSNDTCYGISFDHTGNGEDLDEKFLRFTIENNIIQNAGLVAIAGSHAQDWNIQLNTITHDNDQSAFYGIVLDVKDQFGDLTVTERISIRKNSITVPNWAGTTTKAVDLSEGTGHILEDNTFIFGKNTGTISCAIYPTGEMTNVNNSCFNVGTGLEVNSTYTAE